MAQQVVGFVVSALAAGVLLGTVRNFAGSETAVPALDLAAERRHQLEDDVQRQRILFSHDLDDKVRC